MAEPVAARDHAGHPFLLRAFVLLLAASCAAVLPRGIATAAERPIETLMWVVAVVVANLLMVPVLPKVNVTAHLGTPISIASAVLLPAPLTLLVNIVGSTVREEFQPGTFAWAIAFNRSQIALSAALASVAAHIQPFGRIIGAIVAVVTYNIVNNAALTVWLYARGHLGLGRAAREVSDPFPRFAVDFGLVTLLATLIVLAYPYVGVGAILLIGLPLYFAYSSLRSARVAEDRAEELAARVRELETLNALGTELLSVRSAAQVETAGSAALTKALEASVVVSLTGSVEDGLQVVKIPGAEPAAVGVPPDVSERPLAVVEAAAGLLGMALQRLELEAEVAEAERARVALSGQILEEGTRERSRIALQIHDDVLPYLAAAEIQADNVRSALTGGQAQQADKLAATTREAVNGGIARLREVLTALRRQIVVAGGLRDALTETLEELRVTAGLDSRLDMPEVMPRLPLAIEILVLETVRGCLTNVARHAEAHHVTVRVAASEELLEVAISDDGRGFDPGAVPTGHHGLALMAQRIELARGTFTVDSRVGRGTNVHVEVPV